MSKIKYISKCILYSCIIINILSIVIYYIGATALFRRGIDLVRTVEFILIFGQTFIITSLSILIIFISKNKRISLLFYVLLIIIHIYISIYAIINTNTKGWIEDIVFEDNIQITSDSKYRYDIELINWFQSNRSIRLHINNIETDENIYIPLDIIVDENEMGYSGAYAAWSRLIATDNENIYLLETTKEFENTFKVEIKKFEIDLINRISKVVK